MSELPLARADSILARRGRVASLPGYGTFKRFRRHPQGMVGAVVGGALIGLLGGVGATGLNVWSVLVATLGAVVLLFVYQLLTGSRSRRV